MSAFGSGFGSPFSGPAVVEITIPSQVQKALSRLIEQYKGKPRIEAMVSVFAEELSKAEAASAAIAPAFDKTTGTGLALEAVAAEVGQLRSGFDDTTLRSVIDARIIANWSNGLEADLVGVVQALVGGAFSMTYLEPGLATAIVRLDEDGHAFPPEFIIDFLRDAKAGGVRVFLIYLDSPPASTFAFAPGDVPVASTTQGFGNDSPITTGGRLAGVEAA